MTWRRVPSGATQTAGQSATQTTAVRKAPGASGPANLVSQGFWAAVLTRGGQRANGDAYSPANNGSGANATYDPVMEGVSVLQPIKCWTSRILGALDPCMTAPLPPENLQVMQAGARRTANVTVVLTSAVYDRIGRRPLPFGGPIRFASKPFDVTELIDTIEGFGTRQPTG